MQFAHLVLPAIATLALGSALLLPLRDDRRGKRATLGGSVPLRVDFRLLDEEANATHERVSDGDEVPFHASLSANETSSRPEAPSPPSHESAGRGGSIAFWSARLRSTAASTVLPDALRSLRAFRRRASELSNALQRSDRSDPGELIDGSARIERSFAAELEAMLRPQTADARESTGATIDAPAVLDERAQSGAEAAELPEPLVAPLATDEVAPSSLPSEIPEAAEATASPPAHVVWNAPLPGERAVPLTRRPLRSRATSITWPQSLHPALFVGTGDAARFIADRSLRRELLVALARRPDVRGRAALCLAVHEEEGIERSFALRALALFDLDPSAHRIFVDALRSGNDEDRSFAIDVLARYGDREALIASFDDRIDAIAAQAALRYAETSDRRSFVERIAPHVERARLDAMLTLLAGYLA